jgi:PAS domain S-box-containing protein
MGPESGGWPDDRDRVVGPDDDPSLEPEVIRWLWRYAKATDGRDDKTVAGILDEVNRLLCRDRTADLAYRVDYASRLRVLTEHLPVILWTTDTALRVTSFAGGGLAQVQRQPSGSVPRPLADLLGAGSSGSTSMVAHQDALQGRPGVYEYVWRSRSYLAHVEPLSDLDGVIAGTVGLAIDVTERKQAEKALARRKRQQADAQRLARIGSWEWRAGDAVATWSDELYRIWGLDSREFQPTIESVRSRVHPDDRAAYHAVREAAIRTGRRSEGELRIVRPDGAVRHLSVLVTAALDDDGQPARVYGVCQDITERKRTDEAVRASQQLLAHLLECFPNGAVAILDTELRYAMVTGLALARAGLTPESMVGKTLAELYPPDVIAVVEEPCRRALAGATVTVDAHFGDRIFSWSAAPLDRMDGAVRTIVIVVQDVTERVRAERALARREAQLVEAQHLAHLGNWERDIATGRLTWSDELYRIYGLEPQEIPASFEAFMAHVHPDDAPRVRAINEAAVRSGQSFEYQARILRPDGEVRHYHSRGVVLRGASGRPTRVVGVVQDATERVRAEEARALQRERQARLDGMLFAAHQLAARVTSGLAASSGAIDRLRPDPGRPADVHDVIAAAAAGLAEAMQALTELGRLVQPAALERSAHPAPVDDPSIPRA